MPNINFNAPVIRLGTSGPGRQDGPPGGRRDSNMEPLGARRGGGLGFEGRGDRDGPRDRMRGEMIALQPPTREEIARTIFVGNITDGCGGDEGMQRILGVAGGLRRWTRCLDVDSKPCTFGFAEYEDADSLRTAGEVFKDVQVRKKKPVANGIKNEEKVKTEEEKTDEAEDMEEEGPETTKLHVIIDDNSQKYIEEWSSRGSLADPGQAQFRFDSAREELTNLLAGLSRVHMTNGVNGLTDHEGDTSMQEAQTQIDAATGEVVTIPLNAEDELSDIPAEMRETVAKEIASFRDRSKGRDYERLKREEEAELAERQRMAGAMRINRLASPPPNGVGVQGAPLGPKGFQGAQIPNDYRNGVAFVSGGGIYGSYTQEEEDSDASDGEIWRRREAKRDAELEKLYIEQERRWLAREKTRTAAIEREKKRDDDEEANIGKHKAAVAARLKEWNDDEEMTRRTEEYYNDRAMWVRKRAGFRGDEMAADDRDRADEDREKSKEQHRRNKEMGMADDFLAQQAEEIDSRIAAQEPQRFTMSLGAAAQKAQTAPPTRRTIADVEGLLENEDEEEVINTKRLRPIAMEEMKGGDLMTDEDRKKATKQLAAEIPNDISGLSQWQVKWDFLEDEVVAKELLPIVKKKIVDIFGIEDQTLVDLVKETISERKSPRTLVSELSEVSPICLSASGIC